MKRPLKRYFFSSVLLSLIFALQSCGSISAPLQATIQATASAPLRPPATRTRLPAQPQATATAVTQPPDLVSPVTERGLKIGYPYSQTFVDYFNTINTPEDYAAVGLPALDTIAALNSGQKVLMFGSVERLKGYPEEAFTQVDTIGFDLERGAVPQEEQADLVKTVQEASEFARQKNMKFLLAPVARWTEEYGELLVPYADVIVMQMMRYQSDPLLCPQKISEFSRKLRAANPQLEIFVLLSTQREETPQQLYACIDAARQDIDGVWIQWHYRDEGSGPGEGPPNFEELQELINLVRPVAQ